MSTTAMGLVEKTQAKAPVAEFERFRLRRFVEGLGEDLETVHTATDLADVAAKLEGNPKAVLFRRRRRASGARRQRDRKPRADRTRLRRRAGRLAARAAAAAAQ